MKNILVIISLLLLIDMIPISAEASSTICGDADESGKINLLDVSYIISYLYRGGPKPEPVKAEPAVPAEPAARRNWRCSELCSLAKSCAT